MLQMTRRFVLVAAFLSAGVAFAAEDEHEGHDHAAPAQAMQLPPGHPPLSSATTDPTTAPTALGRLTVKVTQGTAGGTPVTGQKVMVHFYQMDKVIKHAEAIVDATGTAVITDVPLGSHPVEGVAMLQLGRITYQGVSSVMHSGATEASATINVYETTSETPDWRIPMRHLVLSNTPQGIRVVEIIVAENKSDRTWIGSELHEGATLTVRLPDGATNIETGEGFEPNSMHFHNGTMLNIVPMTPGITRYNFAYTIPVKGGEVDIPVRSPVVTQHLMVFAPSEVGTVLTKGLNEGPTQTTEDGKALRRYSTSALPAGQSVSVSLSGLADSITPKGESLSWSTPQILGAIGLGIVLIGGAAFVLLKPTGSKPQAG